MENINVVIQEIFSLYDRFGSEAYIGENISQLEHMSQSALLAEREGFDDEVILAAFFHDIGHLCVQHDENESMGGFGVKSHEKIGADFLRQHGFSEKIAKLVEHHVQAKRYLTFKSPEYEAQLSPASKKTLEYQGGKMNESEAMKFEKDELFALSIKMREWDEKAKLENIQVENLDKLKAFAQRHLQSRLNFSE